MTATITPSLRPTSFDFAIGAALRAGWQPLRCAFDAVCAMRAHGMSDAEVEMAFLDAARRIQ
jgi:hypothetical protein